MTNLTPIRIYFIPPWLVNHLGVTRIESAQSLSDIMDHVTCIKDIDKFFATSFALISYLYGGHTTSTELCNETMIYYGIEPAAIDDISKTPEAHDLLRSFEGELADLSELEGDERRTSVYHLLECTSVKTLSNSDMMVWVDPRQAVGGIYTTRLSLLRQICKHLIDLRGVQSVASTRLWDYYLMLATGGIDQNKGAVKFLKSRTK